MRGFGRAARCCAAVAGLFIGLAAEVSAQTPPAVDLFARLPDIRSLKLSPDGRYMAGIKPLNGRPAGVIYDISKPDGKPQVLYADDWVVEDINWASNARLLVMIGLGQKLYLNGRQMWTIRRVISASADGGETVALLGNHRAGAMNVSVADVVDLTIEEPDTVYMPMFAPTNTRMGYRNDLYRVDLATGKGQLAYRGGPGTFNWIMDGHGTPVARVDEMERPLTHRLLAYEGENEWREVVSIPMSGDNGIAILGLTEDGSRLVHLAGTASGRLGFATLDLKSGAHGGLFLNQSNDVDSAIIDEWTGRVIGARYAADKQEFEFFDPKRQKTQDALERAFPGKSVTIVSRTLDGKTALVSVEGPRQPMTYYLMDMATKHADFLAESYPGLSEEQLGEMKSWPYKARDGLDIPAYLTLPPGRAAKNLPMVVMPHGGPDVRDVLGFDWWAQFLASRGYAVLQPNYRGSSGYGRAFTAAGLRQWGLKMQDDITDGVRKAIADGIADPRRVCIVGASYGGYAALAGATLTPDLYACTVSIAGIGDLSKFISDIKRRYGRQSSPYQFWTSRIGDPDSDEAQLEATSPALHAASVKGPVLLMHGVNDSTVPIAQSALMEDALEDEGKPVTFIRFEDDDHYLQLASTRLQMLTELEKFLAASIGR